jgi:hypothetical protein
MSKFKKEVLDKIVSDADLFSIVAKEMDIQPSSLAANIWRNGASLNQYHVVKAVADYLKVTPEDILEDENKELEPQN